ncbi:MAG: YbhB/YbcL family Raf kinase inhibitor-like protein [Chloroflexota bacterium]
MINRTVVRAANAISIIAATLVFTACGGGSSYKTSPTATSAPATAAAPASPAPSTLTLTSDAFANNATIPVTYSCNGGGTSPSLAWSGAPAGTKAFALIVHDPDAPLPGGFTHWIVVDLPASASSLRAAVPAGDAIAGGGTQVTAYRGMCPPPGAAAHHYHFRLYALDAQAGAAPGTSKTDVEAAMQGHILAETGLVGLFSR